jgi:divalent metal cation (Fe/Co/Zn/Cd) transporter
MESADRRASAERGRRLEYFTMIWNSLEGVIALTAGAMAGSVSLMGFGLDSFIEVTSGAAVWWRMSADADETSRERREGIARRIVGVCFVVLAIYVGGTAISGLAARKATQRSVPGIVLACASLVVMPLLSRAKHRVGVSLGSTAMHADARQTEFCTYLSAILLGGLLLNMVWGIWWADPVAAIVMVPIIAKEGIDSLRSERCCS